ncbi:MAG: hypothetical protein J0L81_15290 [Caulobacterales bacterium]|nr:hypothetical protein [Caulobacterales bacterium]
MAMIRRSTLIAVEILLGLVAAMAIGVGLAWWRLSQGPIDLSFIRQQVQSELSAARSGRPVGLERAELAWSPRGAVEIRAIGISVEDGRGGVLSRSDEARIELAVLPLLIGRVQLVRADFLGGELTVTRKLDGAVHVAFGPEGVPPDIIIPPPPIGESMEERVARMLDGMEAAFRPVGAGGGLRGLSVRGANLAVIDEGGGGRWTAQDANLELERRGRTLTLGAEARLEGAQGAAPASFRVTTDTRFQSAVIELGAENVYPRAVFSTAALGPFAGLEAPLTTRISVGLNRQAGVDRFEGEATIGRGSVEMGGGRFDLAGGTLRGRYDIQSDELIIDQIALNGARTRVGGEVRMRDVSAIFRAAPNTPAAFNISLPTLTLEVPATFAQQVSLRDVQVVGAIDSAARSISFTRLHAQSGEGVVEGTGRFYWAEAGADRRVRPGLELQATVTGALSAPDIMAMWPIGLGESARAFLARSITRGRVTDVTARLDMRPSDFAAEAFRNEAVDVRFNVADAEMRFLTTMSPVTGARGAAILRGNSFNMNVPEARLHNLALTNGRVDIPQFKPRGAFATISARADGDARHVLELLAQEPISLGERLPIDAASASGRASVNLRLQRPMLREAPFEVWRFNVDGSVRDFAGTMSTRRVALSQGQLVVRGDQRAITVSGPIRAGASQIEQISWTEYLNRRGRPSSEYQIAGNFDARDLERLGYQIAQYAEGRIGVTVSGQGRGFDVDQARVDLNLNQAAIETPWQFWTKRAGQTASAHFNIGRHSDGGLVFDELEARGSGLLAQGRVRLTRRGDIAEVELARLAIEGRSDAQISGLRTPEGGLSFNVRGALFDAAPFMGSSGEEQAQATPASVNPGPPPAPFRANVVVDRLKLRGAATLHDARVDVVTRGGALAMLTAEGSTPNGRPFSLGLGPRPGDPQGRLRLRSGDAGFAVAALTGAENIVGGSASADGEWRVGPPSQARFTVSMRDFQVVRLPAMARLLSSAGSLTGLVEMLNGDGIGFSALDAQMVYANNRVTFTEGRMAGPSLGLTGSGSYNIGRDNLDIDGVVAPSPMLNLSMLGEIPVIGDLLVSRRGEGVFGMTYSINGPAGAPRVGVNPVSALTPGILRRIFEPVQRETGGAHSLNDSIIVAAESAPETPAEAAPETAPAMQQAEPASSP